MPVPTNLTPETALLIPSLPYSVTLDAFEVPSDTLWFRYDKVAGGATVIANVQPVPLLTGTYHPFIAAYYDDGGVITPIANNEVLERPLTTPIEVPTVTSYYWSVDQSGGAFTEQLAFAMIAGPNVAVPAGSIAINDDFDGYPISFVDVTTGEVLQQRTFPSGERADVLPDGHSLWQDAANLTVVLYDPTLTVVATLTWDRFALAPGSKEAPITSNRDDLFYVATSGDVALGNYAQVRTVTTAGAWGATTWELPIRLVRSIAVSWDDAILYYVDGGIGTGSPNPIARWDLVNDVALSDLVVTPATYTRGKDLLVLGDGSVVYFAASGAGFVLERYSSAGALLNSITYDPDWRLNRIAYRSSTTFLAWFFSTVTDGLTRFVVFNASDGAVISETDSQISAGGAWVGANPGSPVAGISNSCPAVWFPPSLPPQSFGPIPVPPIGYGLNTVPQRRLRRAPHLADEQRWMTYDRFQLDLQTGVGLVSGQGVDPQIMLRWSNDGGHTWSNEHWVSAGRMGATKTRAIWRQLGRARTRTFEVVVSDPNRFYLAQAFIDVTPGDS